MWNWEGSGKGVGVVVRSSGRGEGEDEEEKDEEEEGGVDIKRREMKKGGGEAENRGGEEASLLTILTSLEFLIGLNHLPTKRGKVIK